MEIDEELKCEIPRSLAEISIYPVILEYFQRKGTAALKLFWKTPDSAEFFPVPEEVFGHITTS